MEPRTPSSGLRAKREIDAQLLHRSLFTADAVAHVASLRGTDESLP
jgi:hypothetical protein